MARTVARDHSDKREGILDAAARVFSELGYEGAGMNRIAREAGTSKANVYHYFAGKAELFAELLRSVLRPYIELCRVGLRRTPDSIQAALRSWLQDHIRFVRSHAGRVQAIRPVITAQEYSAALPGFEEWTDALAEVLLGAADRLSVAMERGEIRVWPLVVLGRMLHGLILTLTSSILDGEVEGDEGEVADLMVDALFNGIGIPMEMENRHEA